MIRYAFSFDSSACSGCKACQVACKDKHNLPVGILWRQVYEVTGGGWTRHGSAWVSDVFAYHLSLACNHCERPICVEVCPANAITQRADGIVLIDGDRCLGCRYCSWACPYNAPQYDAVAGRMQKCDLCMDNLDRGVPPACVASCPLRALELTADYSSDGGSAVFPLPRTSLTAPALVIQPHPQSSRADHDAATLERLGIALAQQPRDFSLVAFTILAQMAVGAMWILCTLQISSISDARSPSIAVAVLACMALALAASLFHLGSPANAWRALANWRSSWVSREILFALLFAAASALFAGLGLLRSNASTPAALLAALAGVALVYSMSRAYRLRTVPAWNTPLTLASFVLTALSLGASGLAAIAVGDKHATGPELWFVLIVLTLVLGQWAIIWLWLRNEASPFEFTRRLHGFNLKDSFAFKSRLLLSFSGIILFGLALFGSSERVAFALGFGFLLSSEVIGRYLFYQLRVREGF